MNSFWLIEDYNFANDCLRFFWQVVQKNVKSHVFFKSEKRKIGLRILEHWGQGLSHTAFHARNYYLACTTILKIGYY